MPKEVDELEFLQGKCKELHNCSEQPFTFYGFHKKDCAYHKWCEAYYERKEEGK